LKLVRGNLLVNCRALASNEAARLIIGNQAFYSNLKLVRGNLFVKSGPVNFDRRYKYSIKMWKNIN